jgi:hypothetical protein
MLTVPSVEPAFVLVLGAPTCANRLRRGLAGAETAA